MKKYISVFVAALMVMTACSKNELKVETASPVEMTLTATIGADTKVSFVEENNVLKTAWEAGDKVSVVALDESYNVISNDVFTAQSAGNTTNFTGTFTNDANTKYVRVFYPALTEGEGTAEKNWYAPAPETYSGLGPLNELVKGSFYMSYDVGYQLQKQDADYSHLKHYIVLSGDAELQGMQGGNWNVVLNHRSYVLKCEITFPAEAVGKTLKLLQIEVKDETGALDVAVTGAGWTYTYADESFPGGRSNKYSLCFGDDVVSGSGTGMVLTDNVLTAYIVSHAGESYDPKVEQTRRYRLEAGDYMTFTATTTDGVNAFNYVLSKKSVTKETIFQNGKMYRLDATLVAE